MSAYKCPRCMSSRKRERMVTRGGKRQLEMEYECGSKFLLDSTDGIWTHRLVRTCIKQVRDDKVKLPNWLSEKRDDAVRAAYGKDIGIKHYSGFMKGFNACTELLFHEIAATIETLENSAHYENDDHLSVIGEALARLNERFPR